MEHSSVLLSSNLTSTNSSSVDSSNLTISNAVDDEIGDYIHPVIGIEFVSPNSGTKSYIPNVSANMIPYNGQIFDIIDDAYSFYQKYAMAAGFSVRKSTSYTCSKGKQVKYFVCSKEGFSKPKKVDTLVETPKQFICRRNSSKRTGCNAVMCVESFNGKWFVSKFIPSHNHVFVEEHDMHFLPSSRRLTQLQKHMIYSMSTINMGPVKAFNVMRTMFGGFESVGATKVDCKNFKREINMFIGEYDASMVVNYLMDKKKNCQNFSCYYCTDDEQHLKGLFWADETCKRNYYVFGDVMSFDATYRSNKYSMVFVPFTGIDNHNNNVTFGAALLGSETTESYQWLLESFLKAFGRAPKVVVTDQDPAMKKAIELVFIDTRHRFCMWHVMHKLSTKVGYQLCNSTDFKQDICNIVWTDALSPEEFEINWELVIQRYDLLENDWLSDIFALRESWIPAYLRDEFLSGLMRTTSRSESENHYFGKVCNSNSTLMDFMSHFETALECQRHTHRKNDHDTRYTRPSLKTEYVLEKQAAEIYTKSVFFYVQHELCKIKRCLNAKFEDIGEFVKFFVKDLEQPFFFFFEVMFRKSDVEIYCSCKRFERFGLLCRHIFYVLEFAGVKKFPERYILRRWTRDVVPNSSKHIASTSCATTGVNQDVQTILRDIMFAMEYNISRLSDSISELSLYKEHVESYMEKADAVRIVAPAPNKRDRIAELIGQGENNKYPVRVPVGIRTKGCGAYKRLKSKQEEAIDKAGKKQRQCQNCYEFGHYASTCTNDNAKGKNGEAIDKMKKNSGVTSSRCLRSNVKKT